MDMSALTGLADLLVQVFGILTLSCVSALLLLFGAVQCGDALRATWQRMQDRRAAVRLLRGEGFFIWTPQRRRRRRNA